jgi:aspartate ammonia-lyase
VPEWQRVVQHKGCRCHGTAVSVEEDPGRRLVHSLFRGRSDLLKDVKVSASSYYGAQTQLGLENFQANASGICSRPGCYQACYRRGQHGNFELNTMMPMMADHLLESIRLLANGSRNLIERCVRGIEANEGRTGSLMEGSLALCTALAPIVGYDAAANIAREAFSTGRTVRQVSREHNLLPEKELRRVLDPIRLTKLGIFET